MTLQEFTIAVHLVQAKCRGIEVPKVLPYSLKSSVTQSQSVFGGSGNPPGFTSMNNGAIGTPMMSSMGMQPGGMLVPTPLSSTSGFSNISSSFSSSSQFSSSFSTVSQMGFGSGQSAFSTSSNPPGFHTGLTGSSTFPRNMHHAQTGTSHGISSLDSLGLMSTTNWAHSGQHGLSFNQSQGVSRAATLGHTHGTLDTTQGVATPGPSQVVGQAPSSSLSTLGGLNSASSSLIGSSQDSAGFGSKTATDKIAPANRMKYIQMFKAADHEKNGFIRGKYFEIHFEKLSKSMRAVQWNCHLK